MSGYDVVRDVNVLFHDAQYLDEEYPHHVGWGHSAIGHALESRVGHGWVAWCSSTTTRITPMPTSKPCSTTPVARSTHRTTGCRWRTKA